MLLSFLRQCSAVRYNVQLEPNLNEGLLIPIADLKRGYRSNNEADNEYSVIGPKVGFVEDLDTNLNLIRKELISEHLRFEECIVGSLSQTRVTIIYLDGVCNPQHVNTVRQRIVDADVDMLFDSSILDQIIADKANSPFPLFMSSERVDRAKFNLMNGQVVILSGGSPYFISGPTTVFDFFASPEDYYLPWILGSFFRCIRYFGVLLSISLNLTENRPNFLRPLKTKRYKVSEPKDQSDDYSRLGIIN